MSKFKNYEANLAVLRHAPEQDLGNEFVQSGIIDKFAMQFELAWKLLRKTLEYEGRMDAATGSPRGVIKSAYATYDSSPKKSGSQCSMIAMLPSMCTIPPSPKGS